MRKRAPVGNIKISDAVLSLTRWARDSWRTGSSIRLCWGRREGWPPGFPHWALAATRGRRKLTRTTWQPMMSQRWTWWPVWFHPCNLPLRNTRDKNKGILASVRSVWWGIPCRTFLKGFKYDVLVCQWRHTTVTILSHGGYWRWLWGQDGIALEIYFS